MRLPRHTVTLGSFHVSASCLFDFVDFDCILTPCLTPLSLSLSLPLSPSRSLLSSAPPFFLHCLWIFWMDRYRGDNRIETLTDGAKGRGSYNTTVVPRVGRGSYLSSCHCILPSPTDWVTSNIMSLQCFASLQPVQPVLSRTVMNGSSGKAKIHRVQEEQPGRIL
ncbi:hypothetical protein LZ30DRAFT_28142 [Colletotrichum cereale]|nr:hypothetical protein LZ30DRAFT_28142 [Colletotrichum cereale]